MSYASPSSSCSKPALPPFLYLIDSQEKNNSPTESGDPRVTKKRALDYFFPRRPGAVGRLDKVTETTVEAEEATSSIKNPARPTHHLPSTTPDIPRGGATALRITTQPRSPTTLITPFPLLAVSDIPCKSPTNKSPFSAVLLAVENEEDEEDDPDLALWRAEHVRRARLAKLTKHLGEEIPAELVLGPPFLPRGTFAPPIPWRNSHHYRKSFDPSAFCQELSTIDSAERNLRRSKSLKGQGSSHVTLRESVIGTIRKSPIIEEIVSRSHNDSDATTNAIPELVSPTSTIPEAHSNPLTPIFIGGPQDRASTDRCPSILSSPRTSVETFGENNPSSINVPRISRSRDLPRRPATADASRRTEKLANFFGVDQEDISALARAREVARGLRFSSSSAAGDLAIGIHAPKLESDVEVKVSRPARFWNSRATTKSVHPVDVMDELRTMRAS